MKPAASEIFLGLFNNKYDIKPIVLHKKKCEDMQCRLSTKGNASHVVAFLGMGSHEIHYYEKRKALVIIKQFFCTMGKFEHY